jgi:small-conductance mechanosensitive channel
LILHTSGGIGYETPWRQVEAMLLTAAQRTQSVAREPPAFVLQRNLGNFAVEYELNVYCNDASFRARALSELHRNILDVFNEYGVQIMTPAYEDDPRQPVWRADHDARLRGRSATTQSGHERTLVRAPGEANR